MIEKYLIDHIKTHGPMDVGTFMSIALGHPEHGYYMKKDPFGRGGDFTTAPEISQMFGEVIGAWVADAWIQMNRPHPFILLECGPGRGTLMADILRATDQVPGFRGAREVHLLEMSPVLKEMQGQAVPEARWHEMLATVPADKPALIIGNEFLDALPIRQLQKTKEGWAERVIGYSGKFEFGLRPTPLTVLVAAKTGEIVEIAPARSLFLKNLSDLMKKAGGVALFIDYGHVKPAAGDTLQAVYKHQYCPVLQYIGDADLTAHVDFGSLKDEAAQDGLNVYGPVEQGAFLKAIGIEARVAYLSQKGDKAEIENSLKRLTDSSQMGTLFKVIGFSHGSAIRPAGF